jgi:FkbM family methyltransferase
MKLTRYLKVLARSRSFTFANSYFERVGRDEIASVRVGGRAFYYRRGTSDQGVMYEILMKRRSEYELPVSFQPARILDIGANIGAAARHFLRRYPQAEILCFEPVPENFALLQRNLDGYANAQCFNFGLGARSEQIPIYHSDNPSNFGGFSRYVAGSNTAQTTEVRIRAVSEFLAEHPLEQIDLVKIDTEGAEYEILSAFPQALLAAATWILGELHGQDDFKLLDHLSAQFDIGIDKSIDRRLSMFYARNKTPGC